MYTSDYENCLIDHLVEYDVWKSWNLRTPDFNGLNRPCFRELADKLECSFKCFVKLAAKAALL